MFRKNILCLMVVFGLSACATDSKLEVLTPQTSIAKTASFSVGTTTDESGFVFEDPKEAFQLNKAFSTALYKALIEGGINSLGTASYTINTKIVTYAPGSAFGRWLMPGVGKTKLNTISTVIAADGTVIARIPVERSVSAGGFYTIGADKYVFDDNAKEIVKVIKEQLIKP